MRDARKAAARVALGLLLAAGCKKAPEPKPAPASAPAPLQPVRRDPAGLPTAERCALVGAILTTPGVADLSGLDAGPRIAVAATIAAGSTGEEVLFDSPDACGQRLLLVGPGAAAADRGGRPIRLQLTLAGTGFSFRVANQRTTTTGRVAKDARGEWRVEGAGKRARPLDPKPVARDLPAPLPPGRAEARFEIDTGGDIMGAQARQSGLAVVVRFGRRELRQVIASCDEASSGNALGDVGGAVLDVAACDGLFRLVRRSGQIAVEREKSDAGTAIVTTMTLPANIRTVDRNIDRKER